MFPKRFATFKFGLVGGCEGCVFWGNFWKSSPKPLQNFLGKVLKSSERWRSPTEVEGGHSHVRRRRVPPRPRRLAPAILRFTEVFGFQTHRYPLFTRSPLSADPSVGAENNITTTHKRPCRQIAGKLHPNKPRRPVGGALCKFSWVRSIRASKARMPLPFGEIFKNPFRKRGS